MQVRPMRSAYTIFQTPKFFKASNMSIEVAIPDDEPDNDSFHEEGINYNFRELLDQVYEHIDIIFTVPTNEVQILRDGLASRKHKDNAKLKDGGLPDNRVLSFLVYPAKDPEGIEMIGVSDVRIKLEPKKGVTVLDIRVPSDTF